MPLWFEIAVLAFLPCIAVSAIDVCFALESINRSIAAGAERVREVIEKSQSATL